jgi:N-acyl-phosphatidylethanolamine-hydrolysing phospholipase D
MKDQHVNPAEAVQIFHDLGSKRAMGVHWGCFQLTDEALDEPPRALALARQAAGLSPEDFFTLSMGQTWLCPRRAGG